MENAVTQNENNIVIRDILQIVAVPLLIFGLRITLASIFPREATGIFNISLSEWVILLLGVYTILYRLLYKREVLKQPKLIKVFIGLAFLLAIVMVLGIIGRLQTTGSTRGIALLPRVVFTSFILFLSLKVLRLKPHIIIKGLLLTVFSSTPVLFIIFLYEGVMRGDIPLFGNSNIYLLFILASLPLLFFSIEQYHRIWRIMSVISLVMIVPLFIASGSRIAFPLFFVVVIGLYIFSNKKKSVKRKGFEFCGILLYSVLSLSILLTFGGDQVKGNTARSVSVVNDAFASVGLEEIDVLRIFGFGELSEEKDKQEQRIAEIREEVERDNAISNSHRRDWNQRSIDRINASTWTFLVGTGTSVIPTRTLGPQSPHNMFLQYMLQFGLLGTILAFGVIGIPFAMLFIEKRKYKVLAMLSLVVAIAMSFYQPTFGNSSILFALFLVVYAVAEVDQDGDFYEKVSK